jgi:Zn-dependent peptidase ImmA (M78 family)
MKSAAQKYGAPEALSIGFELIADPDHGEGATPAESASWGRLTFTVAGHPLTAFTDALAPGEPSLSVAWYLLPFAEWLASQWDPLLHEQVLPWMRRPGSPAGDWFETSTRLLLLSGSDSALDRLGEAQAWWRRHSFNAGADGGVLPRVTIRRVGDDVEISWNNDDRGDLPEGFQFLESRGHARVRADETAKTFHAFLEGITGILAERRPRDPRIAALSRKVARLMSQTRIPARSAWLLGFGEKQAFLRRVQAAATLAPDARQNWNVLAMMQSGVDRLIAACNPAALLFASVAPHVSAGDAGTLLSAMWAAERERFARGRLEDLVADAPVPEARPFVDGFALALRLRETLGLGDGPVEMMDLLRTLGVVVAETNLEDRTIRGVSFCSPTHRATILINGNSPFGRQPWSRNAILAHELCHLLHDRERATRVAVASGAWAPRAIEKRANAFAVMFLIPETAISLRGASKLADVRRIAKRFGASYRAVAYHLYHLHFLDDDELAQVLAAIPDPEPPDPELEAID